MKRCDVAFGEWKPARNSGRVGNISLCQRVLVACCNKSPAQLEALMRSYQADDRLFLPSNADAEEVEFAKMQMSFCNAYLYLQFMHMSGASLAEQFHVSVKYLSTRFIRETGCALSKQINEIRIYFAKVYLERTSLPLAEIAERSGFSSQNYFARRFKASVGMSPLQYRAQVR